MLRGWKLNYVELNGKGHGSIHFEISDDYDVIPAYPTDEVHETKRKKQKFDRAKENREFKKRVEEELEWEW